MSSLKTPNFYATYQQKVKKILQKEKNVSQRSELALLKIVSKLISDNVHMQTLNFSLSEKYENLE